jgi:hypothetical protein
MRILPAVLVCARLLAAQAAKPAMPCADLRALTNYDISIAAAELIPASAEAPEHCRVSGQVLPQVGSRSTCLRRGTAVSTCSAMAGMRASPSMAPSGPARAPGR